MGFVPQIVGGGSMSPIRKSFADPKMNVFKNEKETKIRELSKIKDQYK